MKFCIKYEKETHRMIFKETNNNRDYNLVPNMFQF